jgi:hypothetical protein
VIIIMRARGLGVPRTEIKIALSEPTAFLVF